MALVKKNNARRALITLIIFIVVAVGAGLTYYFLQRTGTVDPGTSTANVREEPIPIDFNLAPLQAARDRGLKPFGQSPVPVDPVGNQDPFNQRF